MSNTIKIKIDESIRAIVNATFPEYNGRTFHIEVEDRPMDVASY